MRSMGQNPTEDEVLNLVIEYDVNGDGTIDFDEFMEMMKKQAEHQDNSAELKEAFKIFDRDGNGYIDAAELKKVCFLPRKVRKCALKVSARSLTFKKHNIYL